MKTIVLSLLLALSTSLIGAEYPTMPYCIQGNVYTFTYNGASKCLSKDAANIYITGLVRGGWTHDNIIGQMVLMPKKQSIYIRAAHKPNDLSAISQTFAYANRMKPTVYPKFLSGAYTDVYGETRIEDSATIYIHYWSYSY